MIFLDRPFSVGDWIRSPDRHIEGVVEHIGWRSTKIFTFDKRPLYVPNSLFSTISVENGTRMSNRRINTRIGLRYSDASKIEGILAEIETMLQNHEDIDKGKSIVVRFVCFASSSLEFLVSAYTKTTDWHAFLKIQQQIFLNIISIIERHGAECAFPTTTVHLPDELKMKS